MGILENVAAKRKQQAVEAQAAAMERDWQEQQQAIGARGIGRYVMPPVKQQLAPSKPYMEGLAGEAERQRLNRDFNDGLRGY
jgi:hypothetical protein